MVEKYYLRYFQLMNLWYGSPYRFDIECVFVISIVGFSSITFYDLLPLKGSIVTLVYVMSILNTHSIIMFYLVFLVFLF